MYIDHIRPLRRPVEWSEVVKYGFLFKCNMLYIIRMLSARRLRKYTHWPLLTIYVTSWVVRNDQMCFFCLNAPCYIWFECSRRVDFDNLYINHFENIHIDDEWSLRWPVEWPEMANCVFCWNTPCYIPFKCSRRVDFDNL